MPGRLAHSPSGESTLGVNSIAVEHMKMLTGTAGTTLEEKYLNYARRRSLKLVEPHRFQHLLQYQLVARHSRSPKECVNVVKVIDDIGVDEDGDLLSRVECP